MPGRRARRSSRVRGCHRPRESSRAARRRLGRGVQRGDEGQEGGAELLQRRRRKVVPPALGCRERKLSRRGQRDRVEPVVDQARLFARCRGDRVAGDLSGSRDAPGAQAGSVTQYLLRRAGQADGWAVEASGHHEMGLEGLVVAGLGDHHDRIYLGALGEALDQLPGALSFCAGPAGRAPGSGCGSCRRPRARRRARAGRRSQRRWRPRRLLRASLCPQAGRSRGPTCPAG